MNIYIDTSFLVSAYSPDAKSVAAAAIMEVTNESLWVTKFTELEFLNALGLRVFREQISPTGAAGSQSAFELDVRMGLFQIKSLPESAFVRARQLSGESTARMGTRTSDILHVATALELGADVFYTFDRQQARLAGMMKLKTNALA